MAAVFTKLLNMSIAASWLILAVIVLRQLLKKSPKWINCILWGIVAVRLVCPVSFESALSLVPSAETINPAVVRTSPRPATSSGVPVVVHPIDLSAGGNPVPTTGADTVSMYAWMQAAGIVWLIGLCCLLGYAMIRYFLLHKRVSEAVLLRDNIWIGDMVKSPFILGIIHPRIYLSSSTEESQMGYILAHEQAHIKRKDHWWKMLAYLLLTVYWFNPLSWIAYILLCGDIELACDEKVVRGLDEEGKRSYLYALLSCSMQRRVILACPPAFGEMRVVQRMKSVLDYKKPAFWVVLLSVLACLAVAVCFLTTSPKPYQIKVKIPAGGTENFYYSDEEISPKSNTLTLYAGEGMGDGEIVLLPVEAREENAYDEPVYITPGMPVKIKVEKGAWFKIGVNTMRNPSGEDMEVYLSVENVAVRVASEEESDAQEETGTKEGTDEQENSVSGKEAEECLQRHLSAAGQWSEDYVIEPLEPIEGMVEDTKVYRFEVRYRDDMEQAASRLVGNYAITDDGKIVYWYDSANDEFVRLQEADQDMAAANPDMASENLDNSDDSNGLNNSNDSDKTMPPESVFPIELLFASGASSAGTMLTLNQDGSFFGQHFDHENARGDDYPNGMCYICDFTGQFEHMRQINAYTYSLTLGEIVTEKEKGEEWIEDGVLYIAVEPFGLEDGKEFLLYLPGTPLEELSEEFLSWWMGWWSYQREEENPQTLPCYGLLNIETGEGFFHYD